MMLMKALLGRQVVERLKDNNKKKIKYWKRCRISKDLSSGAVLEEDSAVQSAVFRADTSEIKKYI